MFAENGSSCPQPSPVEARASVWLPVGRVSGCVLSSFNPHNVPCDPDASAECDPELRCPAACATPAPSPHEAPRVRKALHTLTPSEWQRVVDAMWVMRVTPTEVGRPIYGAAYRGYDQRAAMIY